MKSAELQESLKFFSDLKYSITHAKKRIWIQSMLFEMVPDIEEYVSLFIEAAKRGVEVKLVFDWISERYYEENLDVYPALSFFKLQKRNEVHVFAEQIYAKMRKAGVSVTITNKPSKLGEIFLLGKRNHNKIYIIDDVFWIGGINLIADTSRFIDFMVKLDDTRILSTVEKYFLHKERLNSVVTCTPEYSFLIDSGHKGASLIYDTSIDLIKHAQKEIIFVSQMLPDSGFLDQLFKKSREGVKIHAIISNAAHNIFTKFPFRYHYELFQAKIKHNPHFILFHSKQWIHAKLLIVDGEKAIFGSHNFAKWNELIGIEETGFLTIDKNLITQFQKFAEGIKE